MLIRSAVAGDAGGIARLCASALTFEPDAAELPSVLDGGRARQADDRRGAVDWPGVVLTAETSGRLAGVVYASMRLLSSGIGCGHVDLLAVDPGARGRGAGAGLLAAAEHELQAAGAAEVRLGHNSPVYLWPGVDPRYTAMTCLAARAGYERYTDAVNLVADLSAMPGQDAAAERLAAAGVTVRRAQAAEAADIAGWLREGPWGASSWPAEAQIAASSDPASCHLAERDGSYLGFACHGVSRRGWVGPMGTLAADRDLGIGRVLLARCLADIAAAGHTVAQIAWAGPVRFYARAAGARIDRVFWLYRKPLAVR